MYSTMQVASRGIQEGVPTLSKKRPLIKKKTFLSVVKTEVGELQSSPQVSKNDSTQCSNEEGEPGS